jgi:hypothetical protein
MCQTMAAKMLRNGESHLKEVILSLFPRSTKAVLCMLNMGNLGNVRARSVERDLRDEEIRPETDMDRCQDGEGPNATLH